MRDRLELLLGIADAAGNSGAAQCVGASLQDVGARREVIRERVVHHVAGSAAGREQRAGRAAKVLVVPLRLEDRAGRHVQALQLARRCDVETAERRIGLLE